MNSWLKLLEYWQDVRLRRGLTFPFLIGATRQTAGGLTELDTATELLQLLTLMAQHDAEGNYYLNINKCPDIDELIVTRQKNAVPPSSAQNVRVAKYTKTDLYVNFDAGEDLTTPAKLCDYLLRRYSSEIQDRRFSKNNGKFTEFTPSDYRWIDEALNSNFA